MFAQLKLMASVFLVLEHIIFYARKATLGVTSEMTAALTAAVIIHCVISVRVGGILPLLQL